MSADELERREAFARGKDSARWDEQRRVNDAVQADLARHRELLSSIERRVIFMAGGAAAIGAWLGSGIPGLF